MLKILCITARLLPQQWTLEPEYEKNQTQEISELTPCTKSKGFQTARTAFED